MPAKILLSELEASLKEEESEEAQLAEVLQHGAKLKTSLQSAAAVIQTNQKEFTAADE